MGVLMKWTLKREAEWMLWLGLVPIGLLAWMMVWRVLQELF